jgi:hypothetical protein
VTYAGHLLTNKHHGSNTIGKLMPLLGQQQESNISVLHDIFPCIVWKGGSNHDYCSSRQTRQALLVTTLMWERLQVWAGTVWLVNIAGLPSHKIIWQFFWLLNYKSMKDDNNNNNNNNNKYGKLKTTTFSTRRSGK